MTSIALNPLLTGPALALFTMYGDRATELLRRYPVLANLPTAKILKWLLALGLIRSANRWMNSLAMNNWVAKADTARWNWPKEIAVVTGGANGIGLLVVKGLIARGVKVAVLDVAPMDPSVQSDLVFYQKCDISDPDALHEAAEAIRSRFGDASILVNNAGIGHAQAILDISPDKLKRIFGINILSHFYAVKEFVPAMAKLDKGHVVGIASMASFFTFCPTTDYACTKSGVLAFHEGLAQELKHRYQAPNVHSTVVHPTWTRTAIVGTKFDEKRMGKLLDADYVADAILKQIFSARGAQLILAPGAKWVSMMRAFPNWIQEGMRDGMGKLSREVTTAMNQ